MVDAKLLLHHLQLLELLTPFGAMEKFTATNHKSASRGAGKLAKIAANDNPHCQVIVDMLGYYYRSQLKNMTKSWKCWKEVTQLDFMSGSFSPESLDIASQISGGLHLKMFSLSKMIEDRKLLGTIGKSLVMILDSQCIHVASA